MIQFRTVENQTVFDIAKQYYGNIEAVAEILENNPQIVVSIDEPIPVGTMINIDTESKLRSSNVLRNITKNITLWQENSVR